MKGLTWKEVVDEIVWEHLDNVVVEGVYDWDYPRFTDAFISSASYKGIELGDIDLDYLADKYPEKVNELAYLEYLGRLF